MFGTHSLTRTGVLSGLVATAGGILGYVGGLFAQQDSEIIGPAGIATAISGLVVALATMTKDFWADRKQAREVLAAQEEKNRTAMAQEKKEERQHQINLFLAQARVQALREMLVNWHEWGKQVALRVPSAPPMPALPKWVLDDNILQIPEQSPNQGPGP